ncbi:hypothetical protein NS220_09280 [Microbacterium testaceum]|uniref:PD-(D/E)XK endonuclease-like domain-containing protein n=2 Tax=Microbacterium testaceum TaxID=2033 RepID=A0A147EWU6_MICTE|nr:hypothetical protein NS220_09280 [Microbacterium testaceum]
MYMTTGILTRDLKNSDASIFQYVRAQFPNIKPLQAEYKAQAGPLKVDGTSASAGIVGTAVDLLIRLRLDPADVPDAALLLFPLNVEYHDEIRELSAVAADPSDSSRRARAAWGLAQCVAAYRAGAAFAPYIPSLVRSGQFSASLLMEKSPADVVAELTALLELADRELIPALDAPYALGPLFDLSKLGDGQRIAAEADLIANGLLVDVKTQLGTKTKAGVRTDTITPDQVYQLLAYALLDYSNTYKIDRVGFYSARYGKLTAWSLDTYLITLADRAVDLSSARADLHSLMLEDIEFI